MFVQYVISEASDARFIVTVPDAVVVPLIKDPEEEKNSTFAIVDDAQVIVYIPAVNAVILLYNVFALAAATTDVLLVDAELELATGNTVDDIYFLLR